MNKTLRNYEHGMQRLPHKETSKRERTGGGGKRYSKTGSSTTNPALGKERHQGRGSE